MGNLTELELEKLRCIDSATVANAVESFGVRDLTDGFMGMDVRCLFPELGVSLGYAVTATCDSMTPGIERDPGVWPDVLAAIEASPKPAILVFQDVGPDRLRSCHFGDSMATAACRLGAIGLITDGGMRDVAGVRALGFQYFAPGVVVSHGNHRVVAANVPVTVSEVRVAPGDLLHGDENGVVKVPLEVAGQVHAEAERVLAKEAEGRAFYNSPALSASALRGRMTR